MVRNSVHACNDSWTFSDCDRRSTQCRTDRYGACSSNSCFSSTWRRWRNTPLDNVVYGGDSCRLGRADLCLIPCYVRHLQDICEALCNWKRLDAHIPSCNSRLWNGYGMLGTCPTASGCKLAIRLPGHGCFDWFCGGSNQSCNCLEENQ